MLAVFCVREWSLLLLLSQFPFQRNLPKSRAKVDHGVLYSDFMLLLVSSTMLVYQWSILGETREDLFVYVVLLLVR